MTILTGHIVELKNAKQKLHSDGTTPIFTLVLCLCYQPRWLLPLVLSLACSWVCAKERLALDGNKTEIKLTVTGFLFHNSSFSVQVLIWVLVTILL